MKEWETIIEYKKEIMALHNDIESAITEFEKKMPRSYEKGVGILDRALMISQENLRLIKFSENTKNPEIKSHVKQRIDDFNECFGNIL